MLNSKKKLHEITYAFQFRNVVKKLPLGQIKYHFRNYKKYFNEDLAKVKGKYFLETGAGSGIHTTILSLLVGKRNIIHSMDLLESNIKKINKFKKIYKLKNVSVYQHNFLNKIKTNIIYDFACCHNWVQHTPFPEKCLKNIFDKIKIGGKFYISTYHENYFRFTIAFIARQIIKSNKRKIIKYLIKNKNLIFKKDLSYYNNRDDILFENLTDDFTTPYMFLTNYNRLKKFIEEHGFKSITKITKIDQIKFRDNHQLKMGFIKIKNKREKNIKKCFVDIDNNYLIMKTNESFKEINNLTQLLKKNYKNKSYDDCSKFLLKLYLLRAKMNKSRSQNKIINLINFLKEEISKSK